MKYNNAYFNGWINEINNEFFCAGCFDELLERASNKEKIEYAKYEPLASEEISIKYICKICNMRVREI